MPLGDLLTIAIQPNLGTAFLANPSLPDFDRDERLDCVQASFTAVLGYSAHFQCAGGTVATNMRIYSPSRACEFTVLSVIVVKIITSER